MGGWVRSFYLRSGPPSCETASTNRSCSSGDHRNRCFAPPPPPAAAEELEPPGLSRPGDTMLSLQVLALLAVPWWVTIANFLVWWYIAPATAAPPPPAAINQSINHHHHHHHHHDNNYITKVEKLNTQPADEFNQASSVSSKRSSLDRRRTTTTMGKSTVVTQHCTSKQVQTRLSARFIKYDKSSEVVLLTSSSLEIFRNTTSNDKARTIMYKSKEKENQPTTRLLLTYICRTKVPFSSIIEIIRGFVRAQERAS
jgi:hypothetical protein